MDAEGAAAPTREETANLTDVALNEAPPQPQQVRDEEGNSICFKTRCAQRIRNRGGKAACALF